ncbi:helix-turn-helix domain-containing protein [Parvibaculaceae bacterium PLY_AMNH_Bact1]|nr:helix-turn-helix domain-containing protein [Parvibaculaceae bacterium PLY_AMNH_Bact1]
MGSLKDRLLDVREHFGLSQREMAAFLDMSPGTWHGYERDEALPKSTALEQLAHEGIDTNWLLTGEGQMLKATSEQSEEEDLVYIPRYDTLVAAGSGAVPIEHPTATPVAFSRKFLRDEFGVSPSGLFLIEARGDSMTGLIDNGDVLLVDTNEPKMSGDGIYVFSVDGMLLVKQLRSRLNGDIEVFDGEGKLQQTLSRKDLKNVEVVGRVIWKAGRA